MLTKNFFLKATVFASIASLFFAHIASAKDKKLGIPQPSPLEIQKKVDQLDKSSNRKVKASIKIFSARNHGIYDQLAQGTCRLINHVRAHTGVKCQARTSNGSVQNLKNLMDNSMVFSFAQAELLKDAFDGTDVFANDVPNSKLRFISSLHDEVLSIVVRNDGKIKKLDDLEGKTVNFGAPDSGAHTIMKSIMFIKGWDEKSFATMTNLEHQKQAKALCLGAIDSMVTFEGMPSQSILEASQLCEISILRIDQEVYNQLAKNDPQLHIAKIPGGKYFGIPNEIETIATKTVLVTNENTDDEVVYNVTKTIFENIDYLKQINHALDKITQESMYKLGKVVPIHPGAAKYFKEQGLSDVNHKFEKKDVTSNR